MKPLPSSRPPVSSRRSHGGEQEGLGAGAAGPLSSSRRGGVDGSERADSRASSNPTWMRKLEDRYQRLHRKIASIPTCNTPASRFNFLTRRFLNETLAKAHRKQAALNHSNDTAARISPSTAPNATTYKDGLHPEEEEEEEEDLIPAPPPSNPDDDGDSSSSDSSDSDSDSPKNDENLPPMRTAAPALLTTAGNDDNKKKQDQELLSLSPYYPHTLYSRYHSQPSSSLPHATPTPFLGQRWRSGSVGSVEGVSHPHPQQRSPLLERDESLERNAANMASGLTQAGHLAHVTRSSTPARAGQPLNSALARPSVSGGVSGGQREGQLVSGAQPLTDADDREENTKAWLDIHMGDLTASGVRTLKPISATGSKRGALLRAAQTHSQYSCTTTKSCPAILTSTALPSGSSRRLSSSRRPDPRDRSSRHTMRVLPQMSMEARHAITETLKEMGAIGQKHPPPPPKLDEHENKGDHDEKNNADTYDRGPSLSQPTSSLPARLHQRGKPPHRTSTQGSGEYSSQPTHAKTLPRQRSFGALRATDTTSSVNATVKGGRSPRRTHRKPRSVNTSVNVRMSCKSAKTLDNWADNWADNCSEDVDKYLDSFDRLSRASAGNVSSDRSSTELRHGPPLRTHFPAITSRTEPDVIAEGTNNHEQHVSYKIRGVGSYRVPRERTFEITDPDFDIRYRDVITCQKGDRDTPPPDIFEKSVGKVRDWLNRYFYHT